ncbi:hypothetical protein MKW94_009776 [Papaver nudicaule]|uniref:Sulfotransferase n=1 Tax=Papaver nudicaule TaxID=74823 RepID=A0AA41RUU6_PAPNU|nr:hypothetical protein [Papaver nudicaule]
MASRLSQPHSLLADQADGILTQETTDLLSSLPKQKGWLYSDHIYQYQNFWYADIHIQAVVNMQRNFKALDTDIIVATNPKCGTTWLKALSFAIVNRFRFSTTGTTLKQHHPLLTSNPHSLVPSLDFHFSTGHSPDLTCLSDNNNRLLATHFSLESLLECIKDSKCKLVYICRDPKDTVISFWHFATKLRPEHLEFSSLEEFYQKFCSGIVEHGPFWDHVLGYWKMSMQYPERVFFLKYEELKKEPKLHLIKLAQFLDHPFSIDEESDGVPEQILELCSFDLLSNLDVNKNGKTPVHKFEHNIFFRRGEVGDHVNYLTPTMIEHLDKITEEMFLHYGLKL